jgi:hypothetical protein
LSATTSAAGGGGKITGAGTTHLTITGTLAQVNADLSTLTDLTKGQGPGDDDDDHESDEDWGGSRDRLGFEADDDEDDGGSSGNPDKITINASDSRGANAVPQSIIVSTNAPPVINAPDSIEIEKDRSFTVEDVRISDADAARAKEQITVSLRDTYGLLSATTHVYGGGGTISGNQTTSLTITGPVAQVNADLSTLVDKENSPKPDKIVVTASDSQDGTALAKTIAIEFGDDQRPLDDGELAGQRGVRPEHGAAGKLHGGVRAGRIRRLFADHPGGIAIERHLGRDLVADLPARLTRATN